jgi:hypothetical protein
MRSLWRRSEPVDGSQVKTDISSNKLEERKGVLEGIEKEAGELLLFSTSFVLLLFGVLDGSKPCKAKEAPPA